SAARDGDHPAGRERPGHRRARHPQDQVARDLRGRRLRARLQPGPQPASDGGVEPGPRTPAPPGHTIPPKLGAHPHVPLFLPHQQAVSRPNALDLRRRRERRRRAGGRPRQPLPRRRPPRACVDPLDAVARTLLPQAHHLDMHRGLTMSDSLGTATITLEVLIGPKFQALLDLLANQGAPMDSSISHDPFAPDVPAPEQPAPVEGLVFSDGSSIPAADPAPVAPSVPADAPPAPAP